MAKLKVGINGFGRIGRVLYRLGYDQFDFVGINNLGDSKIAAHLLKYDSTHGVFPHDVKAEEKALVVDGRTIPLSAEKDPTQIPWKAWGCDLVFECTGAFKNKEDFAKQIQAGAKRVMVSAPAKTDLTIVYGVNHTSYDPQKHHIVSNASCTTNCLAPVVKVMHETFGVERGLMTTVHSYTNDQRVLDTPHKDFRRARTAAVSMIPTTTGAAKNVTEVIPALKGRIDGFAIRVPTPNVSVVDFTFTSEKPLSVDGINDALRKAAAGPLKGVLAAEENELVSIDFNGSTFSSIVDLPSTMVMGDRMAKVVAWYDNETGFSQRMLDLAQYMASKGM